ncbi:uncharacterized protein [Aquarana catesbeiana]|uniref:uncharacterized protein isoform X2 n=1 Tax=Aquarana catesbeiana TaxID=8400 RepID=UPI003CC92D6D
MILLRFSVLFLLCGIICCQESVSTAPTGETKVLQPAKQDQESPPPTTISENAPRENEAEKSAQSDKVTEVDGRESQTKPVALPDDPQFIARRRKCCEDGRQHFYTNRNCANRSKEENEAVGLWCDLKFLECCYFMEVYYMPVDGCGCQNKLHNSQLPSQGTIPEDSPRENEAEKSAQSEKVTVVDSRESQTKPEATPATGGDDVTANSTTPTDYLQIIARRKCCKDGRQHFYMNGNCANRPQKENEAVGLWCDRKFLECCSFMEEYYMGPAHRCRNKQPSSQLPSPENVSEDLPKENEADKLAQSVNVTVENSESQTTPDATTAKRKKCCEDGRQHFYTNGNCANRPQKENEAVGQWCDRKFLECCSFMEEYYMGPVHRCRNKQPSSQLPSPENVSEDLPKENEADKLAQSVNVTVENSESQTTPDATTAKRKKCCEDGRQHFYTNGNCANRPQKENEAVGLWCDRKFLQCCSFMEAYYMGPVDGCRNKQCNSQLPSPTDTSRVTNKPLK